MNRCLNILATIRPMTLSCLLALTAATVVPTAMAQQAGVRPFPEQAQRGTLVVTQPPQVLLNGRSDQLAPGARIRDEQNMLTLSATLVGRLLTVNFVRDQAGLIHQVWILTPAEAKLRLPQP